MGVVGVVALHISNGVVGAKAGEGVDVSISVVAEEVAVVEPENSSGLESLEEKGLDVSPAVLRIAVGVEQTLGSGEDSTLTIALDAAALEDKVLIVNVVAVDEVVGMDKAIDGIVVVGRELVAPAIELEIKEFVLAILHDGDKAVVASPGIVDGTLLEGDITESFLRQLFVEQGRERGAVGTSDEERLGGANLVG